MTKLNWAILGPGSISRKFAAGLRACDSGNLVAVGSRDAERAATFCNEFGGTGYGSYAEALAHPGVDAVYIGLPHHVHAEATVWCAQAGKAVLCEKPFTLNAEEARGALAEVERCGVFFMEAWMYRSHPLTLRVAELVREGAIGTPRMVEASFGFQAGREWTNFRTVGELGGGALMDVGSYPVSFSRLIAGCEPERAEYVCEITVAGYDAVGAGLLEFDSGFRASFQTAIHLDLRNQAVVYGEEGRIEVPSPWFCGEPALLHRRGREPEPVRVEGPADLWGHQATVVAQYLDQRESPTMSKADTLGNMATLDALRRSAGLRFRGDAW